MTYDLVGRLLEVCDCNVLCPCWIGEDPDNGTCQGTIAWRIDQGTVEDVEVSGLTIGVTLHIPGNVLHGNWRAVVFLDDNATKQQEDALLKVFTGKLGGPIADLAQLIGEVIAVERVPVTFEIAGGDGFLKVGPLIEAELAPYQGATGMTTTLSETIFSTIPGSPAYVSKASRYRRHGKTYGLSDVDLQGHNAVQGHFHFVA